MSQGQGGGVTLTGRGCQPGTQNEERKREKKTSKSNEHPPNPPGNGSGNHATSGDERHSQASDSGCRSPALDLARRFSEKSTKERGSDGQLYYPLDGRACRREAEELLRHVRYEVIVAEIDREQRDKSEWFRDLARRLMATHGTTTQRGGQHNGQQRHAGTRYRYDPARDG